MMRKLPHKQTGAALFVGLIMLTVLMLLVLAGSRNALLQEKMTGHMKEGVDSFQAAESVLRQIERELARSNALGLVPDLDLEPWDDTGMPIIDCGGNGVRVNPDFLAGQWNTVASAATVLDQPDRSTEVFYRVVLMASTSGATLPCVPLDDARETGVYRPSYYFIAVRSLSAAGTNTTPRGERIVFSTFYYEV